MGCQDVTGYVNPGHHAMSLVPVGAMFREMFWAIIEMKTKRNRNTIFVMRQLPPDGGIYCDSASSLTLYEILTLYDFLTLPCL